MRLSLRYRLLLPLTLLLVGDAAATAWAATTAARAAERRLAGQLWAVARTLTESRPDSRNTFPFTEFVLEKMKGLSGAEFLFVRPDKPTIAPTVTTFPAKNTPPPADVPIATPAGDDEDHQLGPPVAVDGREYRCLRLQLREPHPNAGGDLYIFYPESLRRTAVWDAARPPLVFGVVGGLVAVGLALATGTGLVRRIRVLDHRTRLIAGGDFRPMPLPRADDELTDLCRSVNDMARRLTEFQEAMQRSERLRVLGQFSGGLAHQLRNAAAGAKLAVELFMTENPLADPEPLRVALRQLARIETNLRQFLHLGKPPSGAKVPCDLMKLVDQSASLLKPQCQHAGIRLEWELPPGGAVVTGDPAQLSHLFGNVIGNAVEAAGPEGTVEVRIAEHGSRDKGRWFAVEVIDTGPGPPPEIAGKLFEPFVTGKEEGIGLGLAVAKQAAEAHGGKLSWDRRDGRTVFRIELPWP
ncbi:MAG: kinA 1 [Gemmataceae bacterium]|nr:kinA 1 [Gemmataceae bacterium]